MEAQTQSSYKRFRPERYTPRMSMTWWCGKPSYLLYILREMTSVFVAAYAVLLLVMVRALAGGEAAWASWLATLQSPVSIGLHVLMLVFATYHSITWFMLAPTALVVKMKGEVVPARVLVVVHVVAWILCSVLVAAVLLIGAR